MLSVYLLSFRVTSQIFTAQILLVSEMFSSDIFCKELRLKKNQNNVNFSTLRWLFSEYTPELDI